MKLLLRLINSFTVLTVNDEYQALCAGVVMSPERPDFVLSSDIPYVEFHVLVGYGFYVESDCRPAVSVYEIESSYKERYEPVGMVVTDWFNLSL